jgi:aminopeptidase N
VYGTDSVLFAGEAVVAHELAHQWFGDHGSVADWSEIWLNEGFATFAEWLWAQESGGRSIREQAAATLEEARTAGWASPHDPGRDDMFDPSVYRRGGLVVAALHERLGPERFFDVLQAYVQLYGGGNVTTDDFVHTAEEVSGEDLGAFFDEWLYADQVPAELPPPSG